MSDRQEGEGWWLASDGKWYPPESHPDARAAAAQETGVRYAGFWLRAWAWIIDAIVVSIGMAIVLTALSINDQAVGSVFQLAGGWLYFALLESSSSQATVGKMALSIKVTDLSGGRISFGRATGRYFGKFISGIILLIGFFMAGWTAKKQALHDMMADTLVVRK